MTTLVSTRPAPAAPRDFSFPDVTRHDTEGVDLHAVHLPGRPRARLLVIGDAGAAAEPTGKEGVASLTAEVLLRGAAGRGSHDLAVAFERVGAQPSTGVGFDTGRAALEAPAGVLAEAADLLATVVRQPTLAERDIVETRDALIDEKHSNMTRAEAIVSRVTRRVVWDSACRYAIAATGNEHTLAGLTVEDVRSFHASRWAGGRLAVIVVGDLSRVDLDAVGAAFTATPTASTSVVEVTGGAGRRVVLADRPGAAQSALLVSHPGPARGADGEAAADVALAAVVSSFSGRLNLRLREELGYTYGARGGLARRRHGGSFNASMSVRTEVTADAVRETVEVLRGALFDGLTDAEVEQARENVVRRYPVRFDSNSAIAGAVGEIWVNHLDPDHHDRHLEALQAVTTDDATAALRDLVNLDRLTIGVAGDARVVESGLSDLDLGEVVRAQP